MSGSFSWSVELPERKATAFGQRKPTATITYESSSGTGEFSVPKAVGRKLNSLCNSHQDVGSRNELVYLIQSVQAEVGWVRLCDLVNRRDYSQVEMRRKLELDGYWSKPIDSLLERAVAQRYINDARYADVFVRSKISAGWGSSRIERELSQRGIDPSSIPGWPDEYLSAGGGELERALEIASRKVFRAKDPYAQCVRFLATRGFSLSIAHKVAHQVVAEQRSEGDA